MNLTPFQKQAIVSIERLLGFKALVKIDGKDIKELDDPNRTPGPIVVLWYNMNNTLNSWTIGLDEVTSNVIADHAVDFNVLDADDEYMFEQLEDNDDES